MRLLCATEKLGLASQILWHENVFKMSPLIGGKRGRKSCAVIRGFFLFRHIPPHSDFAVLSSFVLKSQSWPRSEVSRVKRGLFILYSQNTSFTDACSDFLRLHHLRAPDCCYQRQNFACPGLADGAIALMKNGVGVIVKFTHQESSTFPQTGKSTVCWGNVFLGNSI